MSSGSVLPASSKVPPANPPAKPTSHVKIFTVSLVLIVVCLVSFLFGVRLEATVPATGFIVADEQQEVRAPLFGLMDLGWHEGTMALADGATLKVRVDHQGNGVTEPRAGQPSQPVHGYKLAGGQDVLPAELKFHPLKAGDEIWPGQVLAWIRADDLQMQLHKLKGRLEDLQSRGEPGREVMVEFNLLKDRLEQAVIRAPQTRDPWLVLKTFVTPLQAVKPGDAIALIAPLDPRSRQPRELLAMLDIDEKHAGEVEPGQAIRLYSSMYNQRLHGHAEGVIDRLEPHGEVGSGGERHFRAVARVTVSPVALRPGSSFRGEIVVGRKPVYRVILEQ